ncbi:MAG: hypothetical protein WC428_01455 [Candidatus Paceibacterota bacterium]
MVYVENKKEFSMEGYAFLDEAGNTIIIVYGEGRRDDMDKYLTNDGDLINIKYKIIDLCQKQKSQ